MAPGARRSRSRLSWEPRSRRDLVCAGRQPTAAASCVSVRSVSFRYHYRRESSSSAQGGASGARPRVASPPVPGPWWQKRVQSRAYAPPQGPPTRSPPITRDATIPLVAAHTLTRVAGAKPPRHGPSLHTAKTVMKPITLASSRLPFFSTHLIRRRPARRRPRTVSNTRRHARGSS